MPLARSAVAILETPGAFILEGPASGAEYDGIRLFGGSINPGEGPKDAIVRELREELLFEPNPETVHHVWTGDFESQNRTGERAWREFSIFHVAVRSVAELDLQVPDTATIMEIAHEDAEQFRDRFTDITIHGLELMTARRYNGYRLNLA